MEAQTKVDTVVLGGGISGLYAAYLLAGQGQKVAVVDQAKHLGGLLGSVSVSLEGDKVPYKFDLGTHYLLLTGVPEVDRDLLSCCDEEDWWWTDSSLPEGHFHGGRLDADTGCLNLVGDRRIRDYLADFLLAPGDGDAGNTLLEAWQRDFGATLLPLLTDICGKFTGLPPDKVDKRSYQVFAPYRLKLLDGSRVGGLKASPSIDSRLAHPRRIDGKSTIRKGYPATGDGVELWVRGMVGKLESLGVELLTQTRLLSVERSEDRLRSMQVSGPGGTSILEFNELASALPPAPLARVLGVEIPSSPFAGRDLHLLHLILDRPPLVQTLHWITVYEPGCLSFRITLYENIVATGRRGFRLTVEMIEPGAVEPDEVLRVVMLELAEMGVIHGDSEVLGSKYMVLPKAFPILFPGWKSKQATQANALSLAISNLRPLGQDKGQVFGQIEALQNIYQQLA